MKNRSRDVLAAKGLFFECTLKDTLTAKNRRVIDGAVYCYCCYYMAEKITALFFSFVGILNRVMFILN